jgi:T5SS/PEP-CTERM-associated repeat protein/autotransporter-associated beta strand protein
MAGGQVSDGYGYLGEKSGSSGMATVTGAGSNWINSLSISVGVSGTGTLNIEAGGQVSGTGYLGSSSGSSGTATVTGSGSMWTCGHLYVGNSGTGLLNVEEEGLVSTSSSAYVGYNSGSSGTATVTGAGSKWTCGGTLYIGESGTGILNIEEGGQVNCDSSYIGKSYRSTGTATVIGDNSKWTCGGTLYVGESGTGILNIMEGGQVICGDSYIGNSSGSWGTATVTGVGSKWSSNMLYLGYFLNGELNIGDGIASNGIVIANSLILTVYGKATCNLNGGTLQTTSITKGTRTATFNWSDGTIRNYDASTDLTVSGTNNLTLQLAATGTHAFNIDAGRTGTVAAVLCDATSGGTLAKQGDGLLVLSAVNTYSGTTTIESGQLKLVAGGDIAFSSEIINKAGFLIDGGNHAVQKITGSGTTQVLTGSLTAASIVQDTLTIGGPANAVPEPSSLILLALSALAMLARRRKSRVGPA